MKLGRAESIALIRELARQVLEATAAEERSAAATGAALEVSALAERYQQSRKPSGMIPVIEINPTRDPSKR